MDEEKDLEPDSSLILIRIGKFGYVLCIIIIIVARFIKKMFPQFKLNGMEHLPLYLFCGIAILSSVFLTAGWILNPTRYETLELEWEKRSDGRYFGTFVKVTTVICCSILIVFNGLLLPFTDSVWVRTTSYIFFTIGIFLIYLCTKYVDRRDRAITTYLNLFGALFSMPLLPIIWPLLVYFHIKGKFDEDQ